MRASLDALGVAYEVDPTMVRGLDYYTRTVFEVHAEGLGAQSQVGGGGRYDGLIEQLGGPPTPAMGWALGVDRIALAMAARPSADAAMTRSRRLHRRRGRRRRGRGLWSWPRSCARAGVRAGLDLAERSSRTR